MSDDHAQPETLAGRPPTAEEEYYLEAAYKEPVDGIARIEDTAKVTVHGSGSGSFFGG